jgi:hypothetical protein
MKKFLPLTLLAVLALLIGACTPVNTKEPPKNSLIANDQKAMNVVYPQFAASTGYPTAELVVSTERINLRERLLRFNQFSKIGYVTIAWPMGGAAGFFTIRGKVSNTDSQMTSSNQVEWWCPGGAEYSSYSSYCDFIVLQSPGDDGSWGANEQGIFFFTTEDVLIVTNYPYFYSDSPIKLAPNGMIVFDGSPKPSTVGEPLKVREDSAKKNNVVVPAVQPTTAAPAATGGVKPSATPATVKP